MLNPFLCGTFHRQEEEDYQPWTSPPSTPKRGSSRKSNKNNPYSDRGLDKFSALVADLDEKRRKIYSQTGSKDITLVRFVYSNSSDDVVPIVVRLKDHTNPDKNSNKNKISSDNKTKDVEKEDHKPVADNTKQVVEEKEATEEKIEKKRFAISWKNLKLHKWRRPSYYMPVFLIMILILLVFFGRSVAIMCTSIGWYVVPTLSSSNTTSSKRSQNPKKKVYTRRFSELKVRNNDGFVHVKSPKEHRKSFS